MQTQTRFWSRLGVLGGVYAVASMPMIPLEYFRRRAFSASRSPASSSSRSPSWR